MVFDNPVVQDEYIMTASGVTPVFKKMYRKNRKKSAGSVFFAGDDSFLCDYLLYSVVLNNEKINLFNSVNYIDFNDTSDYRKSVLEDSQCNVVFSEEVKNIDYLFFFADCIGGLKDKTKTLKKLRETLERAEKSKARVLVTVLLPEIPVYPTEVTALSERELDFYFEKVCERTPETDYLIELQSICRKAVRDNGINLSLIRFDNVFSPDRYHTPAIDIKKIITESAKNKCVTIGDEDISKVSTVCYVRNAVFSILVSLFCAKKGHIYNGVSRSVTAESVKESLYSINRDTYSLNKTLSPGVAQKYNKISSLSYNSLDTNGLKKKDSYKIGIKHANSFLTGVEYDCSENTDFYCGKIKVIQQLELEILSVIDGICQKHGIKYFLAGGTLLGAVREGKAIPWDDDLDIGMLRGDYEKFRKVCEKELPQGFSFSSPFNGSGSHYTIEKIRLDATYFSTRYSSKNVFPDGIFVDILVYDQTSNNKVLRKIQSLILAVLYDCLIVKWYNKPRKNFHYRLTKLLLPILNIFPFGFYHGLFEFFVKMFSRKKNATLLIDSVGKKLKDGPLPMQGLEDVVYVDFENGKAPIPVDPTGYLNYAYGPTYNSLPVYGKRVCPHNFARIDLGKYVFDPQGKTKFREVNIDGELFENDTEV